MARQKPTYGRDRRGGARFRPDPEELEEPEEFEEYDAMPWSASEAKGFTKKANTPAKQAKWARIANSALKSFRGKEGAEGKAIATANAAMSDTFWDGDVFATEDWNQHVVERRKKTDAKSAMDPEDPDDEECYAEHMGDVQFEVGDEVKPTITPIHIFDAIQLDDEVKVRFIDNGYMSAFPRIARVGIQQYRGKEVGRDDLDTVRVFRPEDEVFNKDSVHSYTHLPVTNDHPGVLVDSKNWSQYAKGDTGDEVLRDGNTVRVPMMLRDHDTIKEYKDGKNQLSVGYTCDLEWSQGKTADGEEYDAVQHNIRANHLAVVAAARGGPDLRIGDDRPKEVVMSNGTVVTKNVVIDGIQVEMTDTAAQVVQRALQMAKDQNEFFKKKNAEAEEEKDEATDGLRKAQDSLKTKDAEIVTLKQKIADMEITPAKLDTLVKDRQVVIDKARVILGSSLITDARTVDDIRRQVVDAKLGAQANGWNPEQIRASFDTLTTNMKSDPIADARGAFSRPHFAQVDPRDAAYAEYDRQAADAWKHAGMDTKQ